MKYLVIIALLISGNALYSQQVLTIENEINLIPEGIAIDPDNGTIFISSIAQKKIIKLSSDGKSSDFIDNGRDGFLEGLGMKVDSGRKVLWALSNIRIGDQFTSHIHAFDLSSARTIYHFAITDTVPRLLNDLVVDTSGDLLITDTYQSSVYRYNPSANKLDVFVSDTSRFKWPNGIAFLDENNIAVANYGKGIVRINLRSKEVTPLSGYVDRTIAFGLDGIVVNGKYIYGVYNGGKAGYSSNAVVRYTLDEKRQRIIGETILDQGNVAFADPTTAALYGDKLYVIANSHLTQYNANKESIVGIEKTLAPLKLVTYKL